MSQFTTPSYLQDKFVPTNGEDWLVINLEGVEGEFVLVFSDEDSARVFVTKLCEISGNLSEYTQFDKIDRPMAFCVAVWSCGLRIALDPELLENQQTSFKEIRMSLPDPTRN